MTPFWQFALPYLLGLASGFFTFWEPETPQAECPAFTKICIGHPVDLTAESSEPCIEVRSGGAYWIDQIAQSER